MDINDVVCQSVMPSERVIGVGGDGGNSVSSSSEIKIIFHPLNRLVG